MKKLYYIVRIEPRPHLDPGHDVTNGVVVSYDEVLQFYDLALQEHEDSEEWRKEEAKRCREAGERVINDGTGCGVAPEHLTDKEYFQRRLEGLQTLEEFRNTCE